MGKNRLSRREALASLLALPALRAARVGGAPAATVPTLDLGELAESFRRCAHRDALDVAVKAIRNGADRQAILGAIFLAGILDLRPRHVGGKLHAVLMVESTFQLAEAADRQSAWLLALWNLDDFKRSQEIARAEGEWALPKRPQAAFPSEESARREFLAAMDAWDEERADRALVGLLPHHDLASFFEVLWPLAARSYVNIGHKMSSGPDVDKTRLGFVGHDYGGMYGMLTAGLDRRAKTYVYVAVAPSLNHWAFFGRQPASKADYLRQNAVLELTDYVRQVKNASTLFQFAKNDAYVSRADTAVVLNAAADPKERRFYEADHAMNVGPIAEERDAWLLKELAGR